MHPMERDASARATHLEAATGKFLVTTIERKQMSKTTNFKRIALVAVAALGMGVLSSVPSQAAVSNLTVTATNGSAILGSKLDTGTAAIISVAGLATVGNGDSITVTFINKGAQPATVVPRMAFLDTATGNASQVTRVQDTVSSNPALAASAASRVTTTMAVADSITASAAGFGVDHPAAAGYMGARFVVQLESTTASRSTSGTYSYTAIATSYVNGAVVTTATADFTITIAALSTESKVANAGNSSVTVSSTAGGSTDEALSLDATVSTTNTEAGYITVRLRNAAGSTSALGGAARESVTITIDKGQVGTTTNRGRSVTLKYDNSDYVGCFQTRSSN